MAPSTRQTTTSLAFRVLQAAMNAKYLPLTVPSVSTFQLLLLTTICNRLRRNVSLLVLLLISRHPRSLASSATPLQDMETGTQLLILSHKHVSLNVTRSVLLVMEEQLTSAIPVPHLIICSRLLTLVQTLVRSGIQVTRQPMFVIWFNTVTLLVADVQ